MKRTLKALKFSADSHPTQADQQRAALQIADLLKQAKAIGHAHAADETRESGAWGGSFADVFSSAWDIVQNFVDKIADWIAGQDEDDLTEEDIEAEVETLAEHVGDFEIAAAIEQEVVDVLAAEGETLMRSYPQPSACADCIARGEADAIPIADFEPPPYHGSCQCSSGPAK